MSNNNSITIPVDHQKEDQELDQKDNDEEMIESTDITASSTTTTTTTVNAGALSFEDMLTMYYKDNAPVGIPSSTMYIPYMTNARVKTSSPICNSNVSSM